MTSDDYRRALEAARQEYEQLAAQRSALDLRLAQLAQTIGSLMRLCDLTPSVAAGLTDTCRTVLRAAQRPLTALEVRDLLEAMGFDVSRYANELASIHTVLKRLAQSGEVRLLPRVNDKPAYEWKKPPQVIALSAASVPLLGLTPIRIVGEPKGKADKD